MPYLNGRKEPPTKGKGSKLTAKQELFVTEYLTDLNASAAVLRAGYNTRNQNRIAAELLKHPLVKAEIDRRTEKRRANMELKADYLINKLISIIENTEEENPQAALRAIELAGKSIALWKDRQEISGPDGEAIKMEQKREEDATDLRNRINQLAKRQPSSDPSESSNGGAGTVVKLVK